MVNTRHTASVSNGTAPPPTSSPSQVLREQALPPQNLIQNQGILDNPRNPCSGVDPGLTPIDVVRKRCKDMKKFSSDLETDPVEVALWILTIQQDFQQSDLIPYDFVRIGHSFNIPRWLTLAKACPGVDQAQSLTWQDVVRMIMNHLCTPSYAQRLLTCYTQLKQKDEDSTDVFLAKVETVHLAYSYCSPGNVPPLTHFELLNKVNACAKSWILEYMQRCQEQESIPDFEGARKYLARNNTSITNGVYAAGHAPPPKTPNQESANPCTPVVAHVSDRGQANRQLGRQRNGNRGKPRGNNHHRHHNSRHSGRPYNSKFYGRGRGRGQNRYHSRDSGYRHHGNGDRYSHPQDNDWHKNGNGYRPRNYRDQQYSQRNQYWQSNQDYQNRGPPAHANQVAEQQSQWYPPQAYPTQPPQGNPMPQMPSQPQSQTKHF
jgi:hypothetical protein